MSYVPTTADFDVLVGLSRAAGIDPSDVAIVLFEESGFDPHSQGPAGAGVAGLNQMSTANLRAMGLTRDGWLAMSAAEQLPHVFDFWTSLAKEFHGGSFPSDAADLLAINFLPGAYRAAGAAADRDAVIAGEAGPYAWAYNDNPPLQNESGAITVNSLAAYVRRVAAKGGARWASILSGIGAAAMRVGAGEPIASVAGPGRSGGVVTAILFVGAAAIAAHMVWKG